VVKLVTQTVYFKRARSFNNRFSNHICLDIGLRVRAIVCDSDVMCLTRGNALATSHIKVETFLSQKYFCRRSVRP